jgi:hypothetical protein
MIEGMSENPYQSPQTVLHKRQERAVAASPLWLRALVVFVLAVASLAVPFLLGIYSARE